MIINGIYFYLKLLKIIYGKNNRLSFFEKEPTEELNRNLK
jgi:hypothetical protein